MTVLNLDAAAVGAPITRLGISFFPVYAPGNRLPAIATGESSGLLVDELDTASVEALRATNPTDKPALVVEGEHFLGGLQNRAVNATVLVAAMSKVEIPVSCVEQGRWGRRQAWRRAEEFAPPRIRAAQHAGVVRSLRRDGSREGDQGGVWQEVDAMLEEEGVVSNTVAASDLKRAYRRESSRAEAVEELVAGGPLPGQCGIVVAHGGRVTGMDLFGAPHLLSAHWGRLVRSHYVEPALVGGRPSLDRVLSLIRRFGRAPAREMPGVGLGVEYRIHAGRLAGQVLALYGAVVHAAFSRDARKEQTDHGRKGRNCHGCCHG